MEKPRLSKTIVLGVGVGALAVLAVLGISIWRALRERSVVESREYDVTHLVRSRGVGGPESLQDRVERLERRIRESIEVESRSIPDSCSSRRRSRFRNERTQLFVLGRDPEPDSRERLVVLLLRPTIR